MIVEFCKGDRVKTPMGLGTVVYKRMEAPAYIKAEAYSICLDSKKEESERPPFSSYSGTMFPANEVMVIDV